MDPKKLQALSQLMQRLPPHELMKLQTLSHNMMAGHDVKKEMAEFEQSMPASFREEMMRIFFSSPESEPVTSSIETPSKESAAPVETHAAPAPMSVADARMTVLRGVSMGHITPEAAYPLLFE